jgi:long-chain acyl-CoA synthetase
MSEQSISRIFLQSTRQYAGSVAYQYKKGNEWIPITYSAVLQQVKGISYGLWKLGMRRGDHIALLSENRPEWALSDFGITTVGMATVTVYPTLIPHQIQYILEHSESRIVFVSSVTQAEKILSIRKALPKLEKMVVFDGIQSLPDEEWIISFQDLIDSGTAWQEQSELHFEDEAEATKPDDLLTLIYTSGTTGNPKGVMLTHKNLASNVDAGITALNIQKEDHFLSFLPLSHVLERMAGQFCPFTVGATVSYAENVEQVAANLKEIHPTVVIAVPRLFEKIYNRVLEGANSGSAVKKLIFNWAVKVGSQVSAKYRQFGKEPVGFLAFKYAIAKKLVFSKLQEATGGRMRFFISGGAPLPKEIGEFFDAAGLTILEGFGLTETSPVTNVNLLSRYKFGTVGPVVKDVQVKIADTGEILVKGPNVMKGYFKNPEATVEAIDSDGWFHTGDIGEIDLDGYLRITDRMKNIIVTSGGKNIAPAPLENQFIQSPFVEQIVIIGDRRNYLTALIVPTFEKLEQIAEGKGIQWKDRRELVSHSEINKEMDQEIKRIQASFARYEQIKKFTLLPEIFSIENGELTPSLKIKRKAVEKKFADLIDQMYR